MNKDKIVKLHNLYREFAESETDRNAKKRLEDTADALETCLLLNDSFMDVLSNIQELIDCDILTPDLLLVKRMKSAYRSTLKCKK